MAQDELPGAVTGGALIFIGAILGAGATYLFAPAPAPEPVPEAVSPEHDHSMHSAHEGHDAASHSNLWEHPDGTPAPELGFTLEVDPGGGYVLHVKTENFRFVPDGGGNPAAPGEGHAHLYVNGDKIARLYAPWYHLSSLPEGDAEVVVTLNTHDHQTVAVGGEPLKASRTFSN